MEIFKLFESANSDVQPGHINSKHLRRDQLLDNYDEAVKTLQVLIRAKENEIAYRRDLIGMLEKSKDKYDNKLNQAKLAYQTAKKHAPESLDLKGFDKKTVSTTSPSTTPPLPDQLSNETVTTPMSTTPSIIDAPSTFTAPNAVPSIYHAATGSQQSPLKGGNDSLDIPMPSESAENRSSLDRRLSEFLKTFPNLTQAGLAQPSNNNNIKPLPGYYTQQPPPPLPITAATPPLMAMLRYPPPSMIPPPSQTLHQNPIPTHTTSSQQENHDTADMDLSDYDESSNNNGCPGTTTAGGLIPMVASAMQQGAGGKHHLRADPQQQSAYVAGQQFGNPISYQPRMNPLPFDPSIMEPRLRDSSSGGSRDKHSHGDRGGHRHSGSSGGSSGSVKHGSDKNKYSSPSSSSHSSGRSKRR